MKWLSTACSSLLVAAALAAAFEVDSALVLGLLITAGAGWCAGTALNLRRQDDRYLALVERYRRPGDPPAIAMPFHSRMVAARRGGLAIVGLLILGASALLLNSPVPVFAGGFLALAGTAVYCHRHRHRGRIGWRDFAAATEGLEHDGGDLLNRWQPESLHGQYRRRSIRLSLIQPPRTKSRDTGRLAVTAELGCPSVSFCWDTADLARAAALSSGPLSDDTQLGNRLAAVAPIGLTASGGRLSLYTPRLPATPAELRFFCELICDLAQALEISGK
jgi:hypothetical protein